ncbi:cyclic nucleotide-binding domain-containing protein [Alphaproteobacteria bacterium]|nr:cyclic nucleotide-binding domain-containing protein [Alphaproteobacteria bacterium]
MNNKLKGTWNPKEVIYSFGDPPAYAYLIVSGTVEFYSSQEIKLGDASNSEVFGEISCYLNRTHSVTAIAKTHVVAKKIEKKELSKIIKKTHPVVIGMLRGTYHRLMESNAKTEDYVKDVEKYSMMYNKSLEDSQLIKDRINNIQDKLDNNAEQNKE